MKRESLGLVLVLVCVLVGIPLVYAGSVNDTFDTKSGQIGDPLDESKDVFERVSDHLNESIIRLEKMINANQALMLGTIILKVRDRVSHNELERFKRDWMQYMVVHKVKIVQMEKMLNASVSFPDQRVQQLFNAALNINRALSNVAEKILKDFSKDNKTKLKTLPKLDPI